MSTNAHYTVTRTPGPELVFTVAGTMSNPFGQVIVDFSGAKALRWPLDVSLLSEAQLAVTTDQLAWALIRAYAAQQGVVA